MDVWRRVVVRAYGHTNVPDPCDGGREAVWRKPDRVSRLFVDARHTDGPGEAFHGEFRGGAALAGEALAARSRRAASSWVSMISGFVLADL